MDAAVTETHTAAHYLLEALVDVGIEYVFSNLGTDHAPLIEEMARWRAEGREPPKMVLCPHENTAIHMALGYAMATGRGQGVLVHVDVGTANAANGMHNACRSRLPVLLMAGKAPYTSHGELPGTRDNYVHFIQEPYDQGAVVRPYVKWEYTLQSAAHAGEVVRRAHTVMQSGAQGPVYLMLPREALTGTASPSRLRPFPADKHGPLAPGGAPEGALGDLALRLLAAERPLIVTSYGGRTPGTSEAIERLAVLLGAAVVENAMVTNVNHEMDCFAGGIPGQRLSEADVGLIVDSDVPWIPSQSEPSPDAFWAHIDIDALKTGSPIWSFPADLRIEGKSATILRQLIAEVEARRSEAQAAAAARRVSALKQNGAKRRRVAEEAAADPGGSGALNPRHVLRALGQALRPEDMIIHEAVRNQPAMVQQIPRPLPGTMTRTAGGGLGASGGMALGYKLARPETLLVQIVGDGAFYYNCPASMLAVSRQYGLPMLTVILDNAGWSAVKESTLRVYPDGAAKGGGDYASDFRSDTDFAAMAAMFGFTGLTLTEPEDVAPMVAEAVETARSGTSVILHVRLPRH
ncbi:thiamine pyrophosphate-requiring protein [Roseitranquillus sediminis]|uniref:thiamine pyrophosphate-requiring protein n=1 Tax=Roseitranquillus sediminis TaxID=2809051 RepID=UPI001D0C9748|nr:thiamine pyrophosphate-requiring protein [Roseitranquillus sediminis]MBM9593175.1 thiamine pyrophosphate-requiring protein [Roseitranquillus sediminis]